MLQLQNTLFGKKHKNFDLESDFYYFDRQSRGERQRIS